MAGGPRDTEPAAVPTAPQTPSGVPIFVRGRSARIVQLPSRSAAIPTPDCRPSAPPTPNTKGLRDWIALPLLFISIYFYLYPFSKLMHFLPFGERWPFFLLFFLKTTLNLRMCCSSPPIIHPFLSFLMVCTRSSGRRPASISRDPPPRS